MGESILHDSLTHEPKRSIKTDELLITTPDMRYYHRKHFELGPKGHAIAYVVWLPYAHAYASLTPLHVWLTRGTFLTWPYAKLAREHSLLSSSVHIGIAYASLFPLARNHTRPGWTFELCFCSNHIIFRHLLLPTFRKLYFSFRGHRCHTNPFRELSQRIFWKQMCLSIAHLHRSVLTPRLVWVALWVGLTRALRSPYAALTRISPPLVGNFFMKFRSFQWLILDPALIWPYARNLTRHTIQ